MFLARKAARNNYLKGSKWELRTDVCALQVSAGAEYDPVMLSSIWTARDYKSSTGHPEETFHSCRSLRPGSSLLKRRIYNLTPEEASYAVAQAAVLAVCDSICEDDLLVAKSLLQ